MKNIKSLFVFLCFGMLFLAPLLAFSENTDCSSYCNCLKSPPAGGCTAPSSLVCLCNPVSATSVEAVVDKIVDFIFYLAIALVPLVAIIGAFWMVISGGDEKKWRMGRDIILWALVGLLIALFAKAFQYIIFDIIGK